MKHSAILISTWILLTACVAKPSRDTDSAVRRTATLETPLRDGNWRYYYPDGNHVLAEGRVLGGRRVGVWTIYYHDGNPYTQGTFDGRLEGKWILWRPDGSVSHERSATKCEDFALMWCPAGSDDFPWNIFSEEQFEIVKELLPSSGGWWSGTGFYERGIWRRELTDEELR